HSPPPPFPYTTLFRSRATTLSSTWLPPAGNPLVRCADRLDQRLRVAEAERVLLLVVRVDRGFRNVIRAKHARIADLFERAHCLQDRKSTRLNSSHRTI